MYITSTQTVLSSESELASFERRNKWKLPQQYRDFMKTVGTGTYGNVMCVQPPDLDTMEELSECDFWDFEDAPIAQEQVEECAAIGNSIDGDLIALHPEIDGYILFPRDEETITVFPYADETFTHTLDKIGYHLYDEKLDDYFEPVEGHYRFLRSADKDLHELAGKFKSAFRFDHIIENEHMCNVFLARLGGRVRFDFSYGFEVAVLYCDYGKACYQEIETFLLENGCRMDPHTQA